MRDPERLEEFYKQLKELHQKKFPDWRFGQFMINFLGWLGKKRDGFFPEEDEMAEYIKQFIARLDKPDMKLARGKK
jgi:hypothetical protein